MPGLFVCSAGLIRLKGGKDNCPNMLASRKIRVFAVLFTLLFLLAVPASAVETITVHSDVNLNATTTDLDAGEKTSTNNTINWTADVDWIVTVKSLDANLGQSDDLAYTKPLSDLLWKLSSNPTWTTLTTTDATVTSGGVGGGSGNFDVDYNFLLTWSNDRPGTYDATLQYTISTH